MMQRNDQLQQQQQLDDGQRNALNYQFSQEELRVLRECNRESFFQRSLPLGTLMGFGAWYAVHNKYLKASVRFGPAPKVLVGVTLGYFIGKISYQGKCAEKIMQLPNSRLADMMRQRRQGTTGMADKFLPDQGFGASSMLTPFESTPARERHADESFLSNGSLNLYYDGPQYSGLDDSGRPTVDSTTNFEEDLQLPLAPKASKSYEELRRQNREEYLKRQQQPYRPATVLEDSPPIRRESMDRRGSMTPEEQPSLPPGPPSVKNKYGDAWSQ
ncbi:OCIA domain-containing protein 1 [Anopheles merus]|uniref:OCIA domain-containing protein n=1 Tax=Anopheles merus TaxID=30066 RepID=A0A182VBB3_ANOME|nr:OCIA domain-containing protein 1 [Anopheles merus]XP_308253.5 OCIA domain-containing protein 1 [Anopheles gambiae]